MPRKHSGETISRIFKGLHTPPFQRSISAPCNDGDRIAHAGDLEAGCHPATDADVWRLRSLPPQVTVGVRLATYLSGSGSCNDVATLPQQVRRECAPLLQRCYGLPPQVTVSRTQNPATTLRLTIAANRRRPATPATMLRIYSRRTYNESRSSTSLQLHRPATMLRLTTCR